MKKFLCLFLSLVLILSFSVSAFAATQDVSQPDLKSGWSVSSSGSITNPSGYNNSWFRALLSTLITLNNTVVGTSTTGIDYTLDRIYTDLVLGGTGSTKNNLASLVTNTGNLSEIRTNTASANTNLTTIASRLAYAGTGIGEIAHDIFTNTNTIKSDLASSKGLLSYIKDDVAHLEEVLADDDDKALKDENEATQNAAKDNFFGDGDNAVSADSVGELSSLVSGFKSFFGDGFDASPSDWLDILADNEPWQFFTDPSVMASLGVSSGTGTGGGGGIDSPPTEWPEQPVPDDDERNLLTYLYVDKALWRDGSLVAHRGTMVSDFIPTSNFTDGFVYLHNSGIDPVADDASDLYICAYDQNKKFLVSFSWAQYIANEIDEDDWLSSFSVPLYSSHPNDDGRRVTYIRITFGDVVEPWVGSVPFAVHIPTLYIVGSNDNIYHPDENPLLYRGGNTIVLYDGSYELVHGDVITWPFGYVNNKVFTFTVNGELYTYENTTGIPRLHLGTGDIYVEFFSASASDGRPKTFSLYYDGY